MKQQTVLLRLLHAKPLNHSANGGARWAFAASEAGGSIRRFKTASDVGSAYETNLSRIRAGSVIRATYHETRGGTLMVRHWIDGRAAGQDLTAEFEALEARRQLQLDVPEQQSDPKPCRL